MIQPPSRLKEALEKEKDKMFRIAWQMCGDRDEAEEVLQETALKALKNWHQFRGDAQISTWLYRIASNTCMSRKRKIKYSHIPESSLTQTTLLMTDPSSIHAGYDWSNDPLTHALNNELKNVLNKAIVKLPTIYRLVFIMRDIENMSGQETADALHISLPNVKVRLHRARLFLRNELDAYMRVDYGNTPEKI